MSATDLQNVHPYPCKFPAWSVSEMVSGGGDSLLDPFCGSGTTLLEGAKAGWGRVFGFDSNPIGVLIARFKVARFSRDFWLAADAIIADLSPLAIGSARSVSLAFPGDDHWFDRKVLGEIKSILGWIAAFERQDVREWLNLSLSRIINRVSRQDSETRYVAVDRNIAPGETTQRFIESCEATLGALRERGPLDAEAQVECADIRSGMPLASASIDRIVTSPPYANTMDYYLYHKQRMNVLGLSFKEAQSAEIGSRHEFSSLRAPKSKWERDFGDVLNEFYRVLKPGASAFIIIGDSQIAGEKVDAAQLTNRLSVSLGFGFEVLESVSMEGRSRSFQHGFQRPNKSEHTIRLTRVSCKPHSVQPADAAPGSARRLVR